MTPDDIRPGVRRFFRLAAKRAHTSQAEIDDEIRLHRQLRAAQLVAEGLTPDAARLEAERRFGVLDEARPRLHRSADRRDGRVRLRDALERAGRDVRLTLRGLRRAPAF